MSQLATATLDSEGIAKSIKSTITHIGAAPNIVVNTATSANNVSEAAVQRVLRQMLEKGEVEIGPGLKLYNK